MAGEQSELTSIATQLSELTERVGKVGERLDNADTEAAAISLFEAERSLRSATRTVERALEQLD